MAAAEPTSPDGISESVTTAATVAPEPQAMITQSSVSKVDGKAATFDFEADGAAAGSGFECRVDQSPFEACSSPVRYSDLADGVPRFEVRAVSRAGTPSSSIATHSWIAGSGEAPDGDQSTVFSCGAATGTLTTS